MGERAIQPHPARRDAAWWRNVPMVTDYDPCLSEMCDEIGQLTFWGA